MYVVVTGPPAAGKSTLARALAAELGLPLLAKDTLKAGLVEALGAETVEDSRRLGAAAVRALLAAAREQPAGAVLDSVWVDRERARVELAALPRPVVEVFCACDRALLEERYVARGASRGPGHFDLQRSAEELWAGEALAPLAGDWSVVTVDTTGPVDVGALAGRLAG